MEEYNKRKKAVEESVWYKSLSQQCIEKQKQLEETLAPLKGLYAEALDDRDDGVNDPDAGKVIPFEVFATNLIKNIPFLRKKFESQQTELSEKQKEIDRLKDVLQRLHNHTLYQLTPHDTRVTHAPYALYDEVENALNPNLTKP